MAIGNISLTVQLNLASTTDTISPSAITVVAPVGQQQIVNLASGNTTVNAPAGTTRILAIFPATTGTVILKGVAGDTGNTLLSNTTTTDWFILPFISNMVVNCSVAISGVIVWFI